MRAYEPNYCEHPVLVVKSYRRWVGRNVITNEWVTCESCKRPDPIVASGYEPLIYTRPITRRTEVEIEGLAPRKISLEHLG